MGGSYPLVIVLVNELLATAMVITSDVTLPTIENLTVEEVPLGTPALRASAFHYGKACEFQNNEFMLCKKEYRDPRKCIDEGKQVTSCAINFFREVKKHCKG